MEPKVDTYIAKLGSPQKEICERLRQIIFATFPTIQETFQLGVPYYDGGYYFVGLKDHVNMGFPIKNLPMEEVKKLQGSGKTVRVLEIKTLDELDESKIVYFLKLVDKGNKQ